MVAPLTFGVELEFNLLTLREGFQDPHPDDPRPLPVPPRNMSSYCSTLDMLSLVAKTLSDAGIWVADPDEVNEVATSVEVQKKWVVSTDGSVVPVEECNPYEDLMPTSSKQPQPQPEPEPPIAKPWTAAEGDGPATWDAGGTSSWPTGWGSAPVLGDPSYDYHGIEIQSPVMFLCEENLEEVALACKVLASKFRIRNFKTSGTHVHVGASKRGLSFDCMQKLCAVLWALGPDLNQLHTRANVNFAGGTRNTSKLAVDLIMEHEIEAPSLAPKTTKKPKQPGKWYNQDPYAAQEAETPSKAIQWTLPEEGNVAAGVERIFSSKVGDELIDLMDQSNHNPGLEVDWSQSMEYRFRRMWGTGISYKRTIEFRQHAGTMDPDAIKAYIRAVVGITAVVRDMSDNMLLMMLENLSNRELDGVKTDMVQVLADWGLDEASDWYNRTRGVRPLIRGHKLPIEALAYPELYPDTSEDWAGPGLKLPDSTKPDHDKGKGPGSSNSQRSWSPDDDRSRGSSEYRINLSLGREYPYAPWSVMGTDSSPMTGETSRMTTSSGTWDTSILSSSPATGMSSPCASSPLTANTSFNPAFEPGSPSPSPIPRNRCTSYPRRVSGLRQSWGVGPAPEDDPLSPVDEKPKGNGWTSPTSSYESMREEVDDEVDNRREEDGQRRDRDRHFGLFTRR